MNNSRRKFLSASVAAPLVLLGLRATARAEDNACFDLEELPSTQQSMRRTLGFKAKSDDPEKQCVGCAFFQATEGNCGTCTLLTGGAVAADSVCNSWAPKS